MAKLEATVHVEIVDALCRVADEEKFESVVLSRRRHGPWRLVIKQQDGQLIFRSGKTILEALAITKKSGPEGQ